MFALAFSILFPVGNVYGQWISAPGGCKIFTGANDAWVGIGRFTNTPPPGILPQTKLYLYLPCNSLTIPTACPGLTLPCQSDWSDFVLDTNYRLMPIKELDSTIKKQKHLPGMPTTAEIKANGVKVGETEVQLLQKVEELMLYVIDLNNKNEKLQGEVDELKAKVSKINN